MTAAPGEAVPAGEIQRQFTRYLRDPDNAPLPEGADARPMRVYARGFRAKLLFALQRRASNLVAALGEDRVLALLHDYVRQPRAGSGSSAFEIAFFHWLKEEGARRDLPPWIPDLADFLLATALMESPLELPEPPGTGDPLAAVPTFSPLARLLRLEWPVHRIGPDFIPDAKPAEPVWLIVYRNRRGDGGYLELNRWAAEIVALVRDNGAGRGGRTGAELLAAAGARFPFTEPAALLRDGRAILETLRQRDIVFWAPTPALTPNPDPA